MITGVYLLSFGVGSLASAASSSNTREKITTERLNLLETFGKANKVNKNVLHTVKRFIRLNYEHTFLNDAAIATMLDGLSVNLKYETAMNIYNNAISRFPFFTSRDHSFIGSVALFLEFSCFTFNSVI